MSAPNVAVPENCTSAVKVACAQKELGSTSDVKLDEDTQVLAIFQVPVIEPPQGCTFPQLPLLPPLPPHPPPIESETHARKVATIEIFIGSSFVDIASLRNDEIGGAESSQFTRDRRRGRSSGCSCGRWPRTRRPARPSRWP